MLILHERYGPRSISDFRFEEGEWQVSGGMEVGTEGDCMPIATLSPPE